MLVGKEGVCQKSLPLTEGMIHSRERGSTSERKRENSRKREGERETENGTEMPIKEKQTKDGDLRVTRHQEDGPAQRTGLSAAV